jgi:hypothetical protein
MDLFVRLLLFNIGVIIGCIILYFFHVSVIIIILSMIFSNIINTYFEIHRLSKI